MGDETAGPWEGNTEDSYPWEASAVEVYGEWRVVDNPLVDTTYLELSEYCKFRRLMTTYICFVWCCRIRRVTLPEAVETDLDALEDMIDVFPTKSQVLWHPRHGTGDISYQTAYLVFSERQPFTRSAMLARLPAVVAEIKGLQTVFREAVMEENRDSFDELYGNVLAAYETWRATATAKLVVPFSHLRKKEEGGRTRRASVKLEELLLELKMLAGMAGMGCRGREWSHKHAVLDDG
jgi:hypothetical protein